MSTAKDRRAAYMRVMLLIDDYVNEPLDCETDAVVVELERIRDAMRAASEVVDELGGGDTENSPAPNATALGD